MGRRLFLIGSLLVAVTVLLWAGDATGAIPSSTDDRWWRLTLEAALVALAASFVIRLLTPVSGMIAKSRCTVCGRPTERGHLYCLDHLQETVNAGREQARSRSAHPPKAHPPARS